MPDLITTTEQLSRFVKARVPFIAIRTIEPKRAMQALSSVAAATRAMPFYLHSRTEGLKELLTSQIVSDDYSLAGALDHARTTFRQVNQANFIFVDVEDLDQESSTSRHVAEMVRLAEERNGSIIVLTAKPVWTGLSRLGMTVALDIPTTDELHATIAEFVDAHRGVLTIDWQHDDVRAAAEILSGVTESEAVNVIASMLAKGRLTVDDVRECSEFKDQIFGDLAGIERIHLREEYEIAGLSNLRSWLAQRGPLMRTDLSGTNLRPPKGVLLVGVPGCGKSLSAKAIAADWGLPLYRLDMSSILGMYVGQSESQMREALETAERVAPCVLWIDEIEKALAGGGGDSGTTRRLVGQFLFWLQEATAKVFIVATANDVRSLPPELMRKGRFDEMFFVDLPEAEEREDILRLYFYRYLDIDLLPGLCAELVELSDGFSGSDIDAAVHEIATSMFVAGTQTPPADPVVREFFKNIVPYSRTNPEDVADIRAWGRERAVAAGTQHQTADPGVVQRRIVVV